MEPKERNSMIEKRIADRDAALHIQALVDKDAADLHRWCRRRRSRAALIRNVFAVCLVAGTGLTCLRSNAANAPKAYSAKAISGDITAQQATETIYSILN